MPAAAAALGYTVDCAAAAAVLRWAAVQCAPSHEATRGAWGTPPQGEALRRGPGLVAEQPALAR